jgi:hypothetical protein
MTTTLRLVSVDDHGTKAKERIDLTKQHANNDEDESLLIEVNGTPVARLTVRATGFTVFDFAPATFPGDVFVRGPTTLGWKKAKEL